MSLRSSGDEPWIFRAESPRDLLVGAHPRRIDRSLVRGERLRYLLYSPRNPADALALGDRVRPASHAVALTDRRLLVSRDFHAEEEPEPVWNMPLADVREIGIGRSVLNGWLRVRWLVNERSRELVIAFNAESGGWHFAALVRCYRWLERDAEEIEPRGPWQTSLASAGSLLDAVLAREERILGESVARPAERSVSGLSERVLWSERGLLLARQQAAAGIWDLGAEVEALPPSAVLRVEPARSADPRDAHVRIDYLRGGKQAHAVLLLRETDPGDGPIATGAA